MLYLRNKTCIFCIETAGHNIKAQPLFLVKKNNTVHAVFRVVVLGIYQTSHVRFFVKNGK
jgi:hypothetical protein